jgi:hypothetical protein
MPTQAEALESKRRYVQSLTRSAILQELLLDGLDLPEQFEETKGKRPLGNHIPLHLHFHIELPATEDENIYDLIFESIKRHFT